MNEELKAVVKEHELHDVKLRNYVVGFTGSVVVTLLAYAVATGSISGKNGIAALLGVLAVIQFVIQMVFFLHVGTERKPRWKFAVMVMMLGVVLIVVFGSLWIMNNLNYRMTPQQQETYLKSQDGL